MPGNDIYKYKMQNKNVISFFLIYMWKKQNHCTWHENQLKIKDIHVRFESTKLIEEKTESKFHDGVWSMIVLGITPKPLRTKPKK